MFVILAYTRKNPEIVAYIKILPNKGIAWTDIQRASLFSFESIEAAYETLRKEFQSKIYAHLNIIPCFLLELHPDLNHNGATEIATLITNSDFADIVDETEAKDEFVLQMKPGIKLETFISYVIDLVETNNKCVDIKEECLV